MRQSRDKTSRILRLVLCLSLIGGIGCFTTSRVMTPDEQIAARQAAAERSRQAIETLQRNAATGDVLATTRLGIDYIGGYLGLSQDAPKGVLLLQQAVAKQYAPAEYTLGWLYLDGRISNGGLQIAPELIARDPVRGMGLLKQSASHACTTAPITPVAQTANLINSLYRQGRLVDADFKQADLWRARSILHCQVPNQQFVVSMFLNPNLMTPQSQIDAMTLLLLMPPSDAATRLQSTLNPEAMRTANDSAEALRRAVADSEKQYPAPPHTGKP